MLNPKAFIPSLKTFKGLLVCSLIAGVVLLISIAQGNKLYSMPQPYRPYIIFASNGVSPQEIKNLSAVHSRLYVGLDLGNRDSDEFKESLAAITDLQKEGRQVFLHIYSEAAGGSTGGGAWDEERKRIRQVAKRVGLAGEDWFKKWNTGGWEQGFFNHAESDAKFAARMGAISLEGDNIDRVVTDSQYPDFLDRYFEEWKKGGIPDLMTKNLTPAEMPGSGEDLSTFIDQRIKNIRAGKADAPGRLEQLVVGVLDGRWPRRMFSDFHPAEAQHNPPNGDSNRLSVKKNQENEAMWRLQEAWMARIGIQTLRPGDTHNYAFRGLFEEEETRGHVLAQDNQKKFSDIVSLSDKITRDGQSGGQ
jgi:hypothetical protein